MANPASPHGPITKALNDDYSNTATKGSITPQSLPNSPIGFHRQNAQHFDSQQSGTPELLTVAGEGDTGSKTTGAGGNGGPGDDSPHYSEGEESESFDPDSVVFLPSDSDSDEDCDPEERLKIRTGRLRLEWRDMQSYNRSFGVGCESWQQFMHDGLIQHGYALQNGEYVKVGPPTRRPARSVNTPPAPSMKHAGGPLRRPAASTVRKACNAMKSMKVCSPKKTTKVSPMKTIKSMKVKTPMKTKHAKSPMKASPKPAKSMGSMDAVTPKNSKGKKPETPKTPMKKVRKPIARVDSPLTPKSNTRSARMAASSPSKMK